jgi:hypothetical protein
MRARGARRLAALLLALATATTAVVARAEEGMVIWKNYDCGFFILQMKSGYGLYEWAAGPYPNDGDVIEGTLQEPGEHRVNNKTADVPTTIFLEIFSRKRTDIAGRIPAHCKARPGYVPFEGQ